MAPKAANKGTKRPTEVVAELVAKKVSHKAAKKNEQKQAPEQKKSKVDLAVNDVSDIIMSSELPEMTQQMLAAAVPFCFATFASERTGVQQDVARMIGEVVESARTRLSAELREADDKLADISATGEGLLSARQAAAAQREDAVAQLASATSARDEAVQKNSDAKTALADAKVAQEKGDAEIDSLKINIVLLQKGLDTDLPILSGQQLPDDSTAEVTHASLEPMLALLSVDKSLVTALKSTCAKKPSEFGPFDKMVIEQMSKNARDKVEELSTKAADYQPASKARAEVVTAAEATLEAQTNVRLAAAAKADAAALMVEEATAALRTAEEAEVNHGPAVKALELLHADRDAALKQFLAGSAISFETLRDRDQPQPEGEAAAESNTNVPAAAAAPVPASEQTPTNSADDQADPIALPLKVAAEIEQPRGMEVAVAGA